MADGIDRAAGRGMMRAVVITAALVLASCGDGSVLPEADDPLVPPVSATEEPIETLAPSQPGTVATAPPVAETAPEETAPVETAPVETVPADPGPETFDGIVEGGGASRTIPLVAGEAVKVRVVPADDAAEDAGDFALAIGVDSGPVLDGASDGFYTDFSDRFYSDFYSDSGPPPAAAVVHYTSFNDPVSTLRLESEPPTFFVGGRGWGSAYQQGTWLMYVAPADGDYTIILSGYGAFELTLDTQLPQPIESAPDSTNPFDDGATDDRFVYSGSAWADVVRGHLDWFFDDEALGPPDSYFSDYFSDDQYTPGEDALYGPSPEVRAAIEERLG